MFIEYDSPLSITMGDMSVIDNLTCKIAEAVAGDFDRRVIKAVQKYRIDIDKDKLEQALRQDHERYNAAYRKGFEDARGTATWEYDEDDPDVMTCSKCHAREDKRAIDFCPHCGRVMYAEGW